MELCDKYLGELIFFNPPINDRFNLPIKCKRSYQPNVYSEEYYKRIHKLNKKYKKLIDKKKRKTRYDEIFLRELNSEIHYEEGYEIYYYLPIDIYENILIDYVSECRGDGNFQFNTVDDYYIFLKRLTSLDSITDEIISKMKNGVKNGITMYSKIVEAIIKQLQLVLDTESYKHNKKPLVHDWDEKVSINLLTNIKRLLNYLSNEYLQYTTDKPGLCRYRGGKRLYKYKLEQTTLLGGSPKSYQDYAYNQLEKLKQEKEQLMMKLNITNDSLRTSSMYYNNKDEILSTFKDVVELLRNETQSNFSFDLNEIPKLEIQEIPSENNTDVAYYLKPTNEKEGVFYINTVTPNLIRKGEEIVLSLHEGFPGHHLESYYNKKELPSYFKYWLNEGYEEGWGFYCESLYEYKEDLSYFYKIQYDILRTLRILVDTGLHYFGWSYEKCFQLMKDNLIVDDNYIHNSIIRFLCMPCQALCYKIGGQVLFSLRNKFLTKYTIQEFHKFVLEMKPCNLDDLVEACDKLIN